MQKLFVATAISILCAAGNIPAIAAGDVNHHELNIKQYSNKKLPLREVIIAPGASPLVTKVLYDKGYRGRYCMFSCQFYDGYTSKWTDYYVSIQPYQSTCFALAGGCNVSTYPAPDEEIELKIDEKVYQLKMSNPDTYSYYLPLEVRRILAASSDSSVAIHTSWDRLRVYELGDKTKNLLGSVLNQDNELEIEIDVKPSSPESKTDAKPSLESQIQEINALLRKGMISRDEYDSMRRNILGLD